MAGKVEIINSALLRIGANTITSLTEGTTEQIAADAVWEIARKAVLREHPWNFAIRNAELGQLSGVDEYDFKYAYALPADCLRVLQVYGNPNYRLQARQILTDETSCKIQYVANVEDLSTWDSLAIDVLTQRIAADLAYGLTKTQSTADSAYAVYQQKLKQARHIDSTEDVIDQIGAGQSIYTAVRF